MSATPYPHNCVFDHFTDHSKRKAKLGKGMGAWEKAK